MAHGKKKAEVLSSFDKRVAELSETARLWAECLRNGQPKKWFIPAGLKEPLDVPQLSVPAWERNDINQKYSVEVCGDPQDPGTRADIMSLKWQADFMATEERAFRTRHASLPRCVAAAHGRLSGHGNATGGVFTQIKQSARGVIDIGGQSQGS